MKGYDSIMYLECPHCGQKTISIYQKMNFDVRYDLKCSACGKKYGAHPIAVILTIFSIIAFFIVFQSEFALPIKFVLVALVFLLSSLINIFCIPIVKKED